MWGIFAKNDKCPVSGFGQVLKSDLREKTSGTQRVWNSLIGRILILKRPRSFAAPSLVSLRLGVEAYA